MNEQPMLWKFAFVVECDDKLTVESLFGLIVSACEQRGVYMGGGYHPLPVVIAEVGDGTAQDGDEM